MSLILDLKKFKKIFSRSGEFEMIVNRELFSGTTALIIRSLNGGKYAGRPQEVTANILS